MIPINDLPWLTEDEENEVLSGFAAPGAHVPRTLRWGQYGGDHLLVETDTSPFLLPLDPVGVDLLMGMIRREFAVEILARC